MENIEECVKKAQSGDKQAFGILYKLYYTRIFRYCCINLYQTHVAQDVCQEVFIRAWKALPKFIIRTDGTFQAFLFRIARNLIIDLSRKKKEVSLSKIGEIPRDDNLVEGIQRMENVQKVKRALEKLGDIDKQIIVLRYFEELSHHEAAKILNMKEGALRVRTMRLLKKLKELIEP